jgi:hypothetical protein
VRTYSNPKLLSPAGLRNPVGPFHLVASWRSEVLRNEEGGWSVFRAYDWLWVWSPEEVRGRIYFARLEPKDWHQAYEDWSQPIDYWRDEVVYDAPAATFTFDDAAQAIARHQERLAHQSGGG